MANYVNTFYCRDMFNQFLSFTSHILSAHQPHVISGYQPPQCSTNIKHLQHHRKFYQLVLIQKLKTLVLNASSLINEENGEKTALKQRACSRGSLGIQLHIKIINKQQLHTFVGKSSMVGPAHSPEVLRREVLEIRGRG